MYDFFFNKVFTLNKKALLSAIFRQLLSEILCFSGYFHLVNNHLNPINGLMSHSTQESKFL